MSDTYKDLDALVPAEKEVKLGGSKYTLPGDLPLEVYVRVQKASALEDDGDEQAALEEMVGALTDLFVEGVRGQAIEKAAREQVEATLRSRGIRFITSLIRNIYGEDPEPEVEPDPQ